MPDYLITLLSGLMLLATFNSQAATSETTYYVPDALGSPIAAMDETGNVKWRKHYRPFGEEIEQGEASKDNRIGYTGHVHDRDTGLTYMGARYYDPEIGRFMGMDPAAVRADDPRTFNRYAYANNSPFNYVDPDGQFAVVLVPFLPEIGAAGVALGKATLVALVSLSLTSDVIRNENAAEGNSEDGATVSDREPGSDGKQGSTGGPGAGKRFKPETPKEKVSKEGVPCVYCGQITTNEPGHPNSRERDHIDPKSRGGNNSAENERDSFRTCNRSKGAKNPDEWQP